ncbi:MAG: hypothetical protein IJ523_09805 [Succinivibrionaceae bacterium]|nr:hypothetical protein [Succinivibrionaceae bacterium]
MALKLKDYEYLFDTDETRKKRELGDTRPGMIRWQRTRTTRAGDYIYVDSYPIWDNASTTKAKRQATEAHKEAQRKINNRRRSEHLEKILHTNFREDDFVITLTYPAGQDPKSDEELEKDVNNFLRRVATRRKKKDMAETGNKYIWVGEKINRKYGLTYHAHMVINSGGLSRHEIEEIWRKKHGGITNCDGLQIAGEGLTGLSKYLVKASGIMSTDQDKVGSRWYHRSMNLKEPTITVADKKISRRKAQEIKSDVSGNGKEIFEKLYKGYQFLECRAYESEFINGVYIRAKLRRIEQPKGKTRQ